jgi:hypothetical protein
VPKAGGLITRKLAVVSSRTRVISPSDQSGARVIYGSSQQSDLVGAFVREDRVAIDDPDRVSAKRGGTRKGKGELAPKSAKDLIDRLGREIGGRCFSVCVGNNKDQSTRREFFET